MQGQPYSSEKNAAQLSSNFKFLLYLLSSKKHFSISYFMIYFSHYLLFSVFHSWYLQEVLIKLVLVVVVEGSGFLGLGEGLAGFLAVLFPPTDVVPGHLKSEAMGDLHGGAGGVGSAGVEDEVAVALGGLLDLELPGPLLVGQLEGELQVAQGYVDGARDGVVLLEFLRVPDVDERDVAGHLQRHQLLEVQLGAAVETAPVPAAHAVPAAAAVGERRCDLVGGRTHVAGAGGVRDLLGARAARFE